MQANGEAESEEEKSEEVGQLSQKRNLLEAQRVTLLPEGLQVPISCLNDVNY